MTLSLLFAFPGLAFSSEIRDIVAKFFEVPKGEFSYLPLKQYVIDRFKPVYITNDGSYFELKAGVPIKYFFFEPEHSGGKPCIKVGFQSQDGDGLLWEIEQVFELTMVEGKRIIQSDNGKYKRFTGEDENFKVSFDKGIDTKEHLFSVCQN